MASDPSETRPEETRGQRNDRLCDDFEDAWREGRKPRIEDYVCDLPEPQRGQLLSNLLDVELELRLAGREKPAIEEYERRFPNDAALVRTAFINAGCEPPEWIDHFQVVRELGRGGFGRVYLCYDDKLHRQVALKVARRDRLSSAEARERFLCEARNVAGLHHEAIVTLHEFDETEGQCYLVYDYISGGNLAEHLKQGLPSQYQAATIVARIADALQHAHGEDVYHRDIKPANILLDHRRQPYLTDFGLAVRVQDLASEAGRGAGTAPYMAPELVRGEGDQIDGRADIYSLGVVLYELLTGRRPFDGRTRQEVYSQILSGRPPRPPREINPAIDADLQDICLKAIAHTVTARYLTAGDLAEKLRQAGARLAPEVTATEMPPLLATGSILKPSSAPLPVPVLPKGLRSFGPEDAAFFLELLPGPRDAKRLPESIRFWRIRIESADADSTFAVGLMYGPSGCGKSSLVKAGLLPQLAPSVMAAYVEATRENTEERLLAQLRKRCPNLGSRASLRTTFARIRQNRGLSANGKLLIVLDQFEQWLHGHAHDLEATELVAALRQVDGIHIQVLLLVRSDFWMSISRLFESLKIELDRARNARAVELFGESHAHHVLHLFGHAYGQLSPDRSDLTKDQVDFLALAVKELSGDGDVIPVRLSLFAEMMKKRPWTPREFEKVGGTKGIGAKFLEDIFTQPDLKPKKDAAQAMLQALLPVPGADIKGRMRSRRELAQASGLTEESSAFVQLLENLNREYIITPTDPPSQKPVSPADGQDDVADVQPDTYYQLTHDYLVPALRKWLTVEKNKTWTGMAELRLAERADLWNARPQTALLPASWEFLSIWLLTRPHTWTEPQRRMMGVAGWHHTLRASGALAFLLLVGWGVFEGIAYRRARELVHELREVKTTTPLTEMQQVDRVITALSRAPGWAGYLLESEAERTTEDPREQQRACLGLALLDHKLQPAQVERLCRWLLTAEKPDELELAARVLPRLEPHVDQVAKFMGQELQTAPGTDGSDTERDQVASKRANAALALIRLRRDDESTRRLLESSKDPCLRTYLIHRFHPLGVNPELLTGKLREPTAPGVLQALLLSLGGYPGDCLSVDKREGLLAELRSIYKDHPDSGVHSAAEWVLRQWGQTANATSLADIDKQLALTDREVQRLGTLQPLGERRWYVTNGGQQTLAVIPGHTTFLMDDPPHRETIPRSFAIGTKEVTVAQFLKFRKDHPYKPEFSKTPDSPMINISWFEAAQFCNWLSKEEGIAPEDWCYPVEIKPGMALSEDFLDCTGYRLPTEAEWEYACRAGTVTARFYGTSPVLLNEYCWYAQNSNEQTHPVGEKKPNDRGCFDMYGNVQEWCHEALEKTSFLKITGDDGRMLKGGSFLSAPYMVNSSTHIVYSPIVPGDSMGFRVARTLRSTDR